MDILNRLKQAAEITTTADDEGNSHTWDDDTPREQLIRFLQLSESELSLIKKQYDDLKIESSQQLKEHGEYRAKVQGWRKQTQLDRESSKKMIVGLRGSEASKTDLENTYIKNLHEQVATLKECVRQATERAEKIAHERDMLEKTSKERFDEYNQKVERWKKSILTSSPADEAPSSESDLKLLQVEAELATRNEMIKELTNQLEESKKTIEESNTRASDSVQQLEEIIETHERHVEQINRDHESKLLSLQDGSQTKYIKDLETELKQWRHNSVSAGQEDDSLPSPVASAVVVSSDEELTRQLEREREDKRKLSADLCEALDRVATLTSQIDSSSAKCSQINSTADAREQAVQSLFNENKQLRIELDQKSVEISEAHSTSDELQLRVTELLSEADKMNTTQSENFAEMTRLQKSATTLQRELAARNETIRKLKSQCSKSFVKTQAAAPTKVQRESASSPVPPPTDITSLAKQYLTQRRVRVYLSFVFILLFLLFSFYSTRSITQENDLLECQRQLRVKHSDPNARGL
eukprot:TRINITY_DN1679_c3_g1_i1.p1 TRINITY_DN1679_c3_g1~~TRINITY_DN1679_c3_g1_i1.p1  ORF type:complete len:526 (+),score=107.98 TRINITY_DN1679_c3_g1_i1:46-1623(+)